jgi:hypothetical protein
MVSFGRRLQIKRWFFFLENLWFRPYFDLDITTASFTREEINIEETYKNSFGIISADGALPQEILLKFDNEQANYVKALPLHHSQTIISEDENETVFKVFVVPTYDFQREISLTENGCKFWLQNLSKRNERRSRNHAQEFFVIAKK